MRNLIASFLIALVINNIYPQEISYWESIKINQSEASWSGAFPSAIKMNNGNMVFAWWANGFNRFSLRIYDNSLLPLTDELTFEGNAGLNKKTKKVSSTYDEIISMLPLNNNNFTLFYEIEDGLQAYIFNDSGTSVSSFIILVPDASPQKPKLCLLNDGNFVVVWHLGPDAGATRSGDSRGIYFQIFSQEGESKSEIIKANTIDSNNEWNPDIIATQNGGFIIVWQRGLWDIDKADIHFQRFNNNGVKNGSEFKVNQSLNGYNSDPCISLAPNGSNIITWINKSSIYLAEINESNGLIIFEPDLATETYEIRNNQHLKLFNGNLAIAYTNSDDQNYISIFSEGNELIVNKNLGGNESTLKLIDYNEEGFLMCWHGEEDTIFCRYLLNEPIIHTLEQFDLYFPMNDEIVKTNEVKFLWHQSTKIKKCYDEEIKYQLFVDKTSGFENPIKISEIIDTSISLWVDNQLRADETYFWKVLAKNIAGDSLWSSNINGFYIDPNATGAEEISSEIPTEFKLHQNYPNPFNPTTTIRYAIPNSTVISNPQRGERSQNQEISPSGRNDFVSLKVYSVLGKEIKTLVNKTQPAGNYEVNFDASNLPSGVYYYQIKVGNYQQTKKMVLVR